MTGTLLLSLAAGILTVAAPCVLPLLPVIIGGAIARDDRGRWARGRPYLIVASLAASIVAFTLLLKASTALLGIPPQVWQIVSGVVIILLGVNLLFPTLWDRVSAVLKLSSRSDAMLNRSLSRRGIGGDILTGAALGPVFTSCSPTYALIVAAVLPVSLAQGVLYVVAYAVGLAAMLLLIALLGRRIVRRLGWLADPDGWFRRMVGVLFVLVGIAVITGFDKQLQTWILDAGLYDPIERLEKILGTR
ncbi:cytochrome c biogenesis CcdA family protein [Microbacterium allomyrinae]|uniref:Sulfite exporter TauE/SafE family protein n=1 Tax=Microbacterium allomyrinae TaxID=2830666 RepID=A0A9X1S1P7_9MICO|nr:cytochrome c biogenesis protein CcdA [Microbacterium allomyrinae]MCC2031856.1 sulfite exporter TauE/SafE family protein [Microbacterium allomyrinae]